MPRKRLDFFALVCERVCIRTQTRRPEREGCSSTVVLLKFE